MAQPLIEIKQLGKTFQVKGQTITALEDINLEIMQGEIFGIIGMSGAGKSTLVRCINFLERPTTGTVIFDGQDLMTMAPAALRQVRRSMGMIFQQFNLLMQRTALENVLFPLEIAGVPKDEARARALALLETVGLADRAHAYPAQLSGGQKQRVAIARALTTNPAVLLCDEATSALDPQTTQSILTLLKELAKERGITVIIITHEMAVIEEVCQRVAIIAENRIAEVGRVEDIFSRPQSAATKKLVYPDGENQPQFDRSGGQLVRIVFDGNSSFEPIIAQMVLDLKILVNIMFADTKNIDGQAFGQIIIQLPEDARIAQKAITYLKSKNVTIEEVDALV